MQGSGQKDHGKHGVVIARKGHHGCGKDNRHRAGGAGYLGGRAAEKRGKKTKGNGPVQTSGSTCATGHAKGKGEGEGNDTGGEAAKQITFDGAEGK